MTKGLMLEQIRLTCTVRNIWRIVRLICLLMLGYKGLKSGYYEIISHVTNSIFHLQKRNPLLRCQRKDLVPVPWEVRSPRPPETQVQGFELRRTRQSFHLETRVPARLEQRGADYAEKGKAETTHGLFQSRGTTMVEKTLRRKEKRFEVERRRLRGLGMRTRDLLEECEIRAVTVKTANFRMRKQNKSLAKPAEKRRQMWRARKR